jgi:hypothetical protein
MRFCYVQIDTNAQRAQSGKAPSEVLAGASTLNDRDCGNWLPRQVDGEHASSTRQVARKDPPIVRFSAPSAEGKTKTHAGSIGAALLEWAKELVNEHALGVCANPERDGRPRLCELQGVLQKVSDDRGENVSVSRDHHAVFDRRDDEPDRTG